MGSISDPSPALLLIAAFSRYPEALDWARSKAIEAWGPIALESQPFEFLETDYYEASMGRDLRKRFWAFEQLTEQDQLLGFKRQTNVWEDEYAQLGRHPEPRPLNLDPGYLTLAKLVLASTKDHAHRIYLAKGIYAEVTLHYQKGQWRHRPWTFTDYRRADYWAFFTKCRDYIRAEGPGHKVP